MNKDLKLVMVILIIEFIFAGLILFLGKTYIKKERPDELCSKMTEISNSQSLIGLSKEEVIVTLGEPVYKSNGDKHYQFDAGKVDKGTFWNDKTIFFDCTYGCRLNVVFDENDKVKSTSIQLIP